MSEKLKQCPFCKGEFAFDFEAKNFRCGTCGATVPPDPYARTVNTRPIEDELTARIAELEDQLEDWTNNGWAEDYKARIAELEAEIDQLTAHSDIERQDDKWIPVSERLPLLRDSKAVLVYTKSGETYSGLYLGNNEWTGLLHDFREGDVTHWMPLPELPEVQQ